MSWIDIAWPMMGAASLTLGSIHLLIWFRQRGQPAHLVFSVAAGAVGMLAIIELLTMRTQDPVQYATLLRWAHLAIAVIAVSLVGFVLLHFRAGRPWLAITACALRVGSVAASFWVGATLNFATVASLDQVEIWGGDVISIPMGSPNPWMFLAQLSNVLLIAFFVDALATVWRRGDSEERLRALVVCGSMALFVALTSLLAVSVVLGWVAAPLSISVAFLLVIMAMSYILGSDVIRGARLGRRLQERERELLESEQRMQLAAHAAGLGMWTWDLETDRSWFSESGNALLGLSTDQHVGRDAFMAKVHPEDRERIQHALHEAGDDDGNYTCEYRMPQADGRDRWIAVEGRVEYSATGTPRVMRGVILDISERVRLEQESTLQRDELAHLSRVTMLGEMAGSIAHELNQPLTAVLSNAQAALRFLDREQPDLDEVRGCLEDIVSNDNRASDVIRRLRAMLRKESVNFQALSLNEVVRDVLHLIASDILTRNVTVSLDLADDMPLVDGDRVQLQQVLLNLVINGCDAMEDVVGTRTLTVSTREVPGPAVQVSIGDVGHGIAPDQLARIFSPFVTSKLEGIGLGLSICRTIIETHGGSIFATNNETRGATVHFQLPTRAPAPAMDHP